jgi:Txe/YoeB family toxin of Txe-Axe toxin-antitoxin module
MATRARLQELDALIDSRARGRLTAALVDVIHSKADDAAKRQTLERLQDEYGPIWSERISAASRFWSDWPVLEALTMLQNATR